MAEVIARSLRLSSPPDTVDTVQDLLATIWAQTPGLDSADQMAAELAIVELTANVIEHANRGRDITFSLSIAVYDDRIEATVTDSGSVEKVELGGRAMPESLAERGRGLPLMHSLTDSVEHRRAGGANHWTVVRARRAATPRTRRSMPSISIG